VTLSIDTDDPGSLAFRPVGLLEGGAAKAASGDGAALKLAGGWIAFTACEAVWRGAGAIRSRTLTLPELERLAAGGSPLARRATLLLERLTVPRPPFAGIGLDRPRIMSIVNVTPDSFHVHHPEPETALALARIHIAAGADIVDVGGESTRPGAAPVAEETELMRVLPVLRGLADAGAPVSIDTRHVAVMREALAAGARIVNDVNALKAPGATELVRSSGAAAVVMHMKGEPVTMNLDPCYDHAPYEIFRYLEARVDACVAAGIARSRLAVDPGIGFGMTVAHKREVLDWASLYHGIGCAVLIGASGKLPGGIDASLAAAVGAARQGVQIVRVHEVAETRAALEAAVPPPAAPLGRRGIPTSSGPR
jgi:dihydropteroate synthase